MVSAGLDTIPANLTMGIGYLSSPHGREIQEHAYAEIEKAYPNGDAWEKCLIEEKVPYVSAFVKETLRFWSVIPMSLPRKSTKDIKWEKATIPAGTTFYMNALAANHDETHFPSPTLFNPDRYLPSPSHSPSPSEKSQKSPLSGTLHFAYGAGSRMCIGSHLANRSLYTAFLRLIFVFHIVAAMDPRDRPVLDPWECNGNRTGLTVEPRAFRVGFRVRGERGRGGEGEE